MLSAQKLRSFQILNQLYVQTKRNIHYTGNIVRRTEGKY